METEVVLVAQSNKDDGMTALRDALSPSEAARIAGVSESAIRLWMRSGRLRFTATPLGRLVDPVALGQFIAARETAARARAKLAESRR